MNQSETIGGSCPKRIWVMQTLSDDELTPRGDALPRGLEHHLAQCPSCAALARSLQSVTAGLASLADEEPEAEFMAAANQNVMSLLNAGAFAEKSQAVDDLEWDLLVQRHPRRNILRRLAGYAVAAMIGLAVGVFWFSSTDVGQQTWHGFSSRINTSDDPTLPHGPSPLEWLRRLSPDHGDGAQNAFLTHGPPTEEEASHRSANQSPCGFAHQLEGSVCDETCPYRRAIPPYRPPSAPATPPEVQTLDIPRSGGSTDR